DCERKRSLPENGVGLKRCRMIRSRRYETNKLQVFLFFFFFFVLDSYIAANVRRPEEAEIDGLVTVLIYEGELTIHDVVQIMPFKCRYHDIEDPPPVNAFS